jgi:uncharacterized protein (TIGR03083 family)
MMLEDRLTTLDGLWSAWKVHGQTMTDEQWGRSTRLDTWDVRSLFAHAGAWPFAFSSLVDRVREVEPTHATAALLLRDFNHPDGIATRRADQVAAGARQDATRYSTAQMIEQFASTGPLAIATARQRGPVVVDYFGLAMLRLDEAVSIGIMEATVHLLDLQRALDRSPDVPADGLAHTVAVLTQMAPPVDLIEVATGRSTAALFPILR